VASASPEAHSTNLLHGLTCDAPAWCAANRRHASRHEFLIVTHQSFSAIRRPKLSVRDDRADFLRCWHADPRTPGRTSAVQMSRSSFDGNGIKCAESHLGGIFAAAMIVLRSVACRYLHRLVAPEHSIVAALSTAQGGSQPRAVAGTRKAVWERGQHGQVHRDDQWRAASKTMHSDNVRYPGQAPECGTHLASSSIILDMIPTLISENDRDRDTGTWRAAGYRRFADARQLVAFQSLMASFSEPVATLVNQRQLSVDQGSARPLRDATTTRSVCAKEQRSPAAVFPRSWPAASNSRTYSSAYSLLEQPRFPTFRSSSIRARVLLLSAPPAAGKSTI